MIFDEEVLGTCVEVPASCLEVPACGSSFPLRRGRCGAADYLPMREVIFE